MSAAPGTVFPARPSKSVIEPKLTCGEAEMQRRANGVGKRREKHTALAVVVYAKLG